MTPAYIAIGSAVCFAALVTAVLPSTRASKAERLEMLAVDSDAGGTSRFRRVVDAARSLWSVRSGVSSRRKFEEGVEDVLVDIAEGVRAGESLLQALKRVSAHASGPWRPLLRDVLARYDGGVSLSEALRVLAGAGGKGTELMVIALEIHQRVGGDLPSALLGLAQTVRDQRLLVGDMRARTSEARWTAYLLAALPVFLGVYMLWSAPGMMAPLIAGGVGKVALLYAGVSWLAGIATLRRLTRFAEE